MKFFELAPPPSLIAAAWSVGIGPYLFKNHNLFEGIDLDLSKPVKEAPIASAPVANPLADTLRVKLNLARAYITIEDFSAAKKSLDEVLRMSNSVDPAITIEAQGLLAEISHRNT